MMILDMDITVREIPKLLDQLQDALLAVHQ